MTPQNNWLERNNQYLAAGVAWIHARLAQLAHPDDPTQAEAVNKAHHALHTLTQDDSFIPALEMLGETLGLSDFERNLLLLCAAMELHTRTAALCAQAQDDPGKPYPSFALAFALFDDPDWGAMPPHAPLRHWRLVDIHQAGTQPLTAAALSIDERILNFLKGLNHLDDRLSPFLHGLPMDRASRQAMLPPSLQQQAEHISTHLQQAGEQNTTPPLIELLGHDTLSKHLLAGEVCRRHGLHLQHLQLKSLPTAVGELDSFIRLWQRECLLMPLALLIDVDGLDDSNTLALTRLLERSGNVIFLDVSDAIPGLQRERLAVDIHKPTVEEQQQLWADALQEQAGDYPQRLAQQFSFNPQQIHTLARLAVNVPRNDTPAESDSLWQSCRNAARAGMEQLARRIDAKAHWDQLVLPKEQKDLLQHITQQVAWRGRVYEDWGFRQRMNRGLGISALFCGESGTGKTMAAEVIANTLQLDLYRIDLSSVVSKYIGETEKNLRKLFDTAEDSGAILFFDEADALFGKRSEVKDSHDRYANIEINYLLQRMESYRGLAILASNMKSALDKAFVRRLRFIVDFPFPGSEERAEIWRKVFPAETPLGEDFDSQRLAKLNLAGGNIHNVALNAAFLAAQNGTAVTMPLILSAARDEYKKLERPAKASDFSWSDNTGIAV
ncbi:MAG TPA: AAA family ATPase [Gammaproteobacteria bacterium]|nr:AAA family ATPase [Gammaproteobacteria bacterium]